MIYCIVKSIDYLKIYFTLLFFECVLLLSIKSKPNIDFGEIRGFLLVKFKKSTDPLILFLGFSGNIGSIFEFVLFFLYFYEKKNVL
jgi:hypothetical protein